MKQSIFFAGFAFALVALPLASGCKKKDAAGTGSAGSATAPSTGSGSAAPAAGSGSAAAPAGSGAGSAAAPAAGGDTVPWAADTAPIPSNSKVTGKRDGNDQGTFDHALYFTYTDKYGTTNYELHLVNNCDKFSCAHYGAKNGGVFSTDKLYEDCPNAVTMDINFRGEEAPKVGPVDVDVSINGPSSGGGLSGDPMKGSSITALGDKEVKGKIAAKADAKNEANGEFTAKNCGTMVFPKK